MKEEKSNTEEMDKESDNIKTEEKKKPVAKKQKNPTKSTEKKKTTTNSRKATENKKSGTTLNKNVATSAKKTATTKKVEKKTATTSSKKEETKKDTGTSSKNVVKKKSTTTANKNEEKKKNVTTIEKKKKQVKNLPIEVEENVEQEEINNQQPIKLVDNIDDKKLEKIGEEIKKNKEKKKKVAKSKDKKYKIILTNIMVAITIVVYFALLILGKQKIPTIEYINDLKTFIIFEVVIAIVLFEKAYKQDNSYLMIHGIEVTILGSATVWILDLFSKQNEAINMYMIITMSVFVLYYLVKSLVIVLRNKKR